MLTRVAANVADPEKAARPALADRRMHRRYEFSAAIEVLDFSRGDGDLERAARIEGQVTDLGKRGCFVNTARPFCVGTVVSARITHAMKTCEVQARVVYSLDDQGMGLMFTDAQPEQLHTLDAWLVISREASWFASTRRRSQRVVIRIPVKIFSAREAKRSFEEDTYTLVVNAHGASFILSEPVSKGDQLILQNRQTSAMQECTVVRAGDPHGNRLEVAAEFLVPNSTFWQIAFPPEDWKPGVTHIIKRT